ncbi:MAG: putative membrane channel-forming protein YqfA (hemolysin III family) [Candidatus Azotimanducaceae bacterium]|jgi:predicted membrane channel-forming protein YqfA (hemolysin III family)
MDADKTDKPMLKKVSTILFYLAAAWCVVIGIQNQTIAGAGDLPWIAKALEGQDLSAFNPILAIWAHWIGMLLIVAGAAILVLIPRIHDSPGTLLAAGIISSGTISAQVFSVVSLGAFGPVLIAASVAVTISFAAPILGFLAARTRP